MPSCAEIQVQAQSMRSRAAMPESPVYYLNAMRGQERNNKQTADGTSDEIYPTSYTMKDYPHSGVLERLAFMLVRPPRFIYNPNILKPKKKLSQQFEIEHFTIPFQLTLYKPSKIRYVLLYLHGNGSSRYEGTLFLPSLPEGVALACFDFCGCGNRGQGSFITLGQNESKEVDIAAQFLKRKGYYVVGWGRSMGAASLLMSNECDIMVCDSSYANLSVLCKESSSRFLPKACCCFFHCLFPCVFGCIKWKVCSLSGLEIENMDICKRVEGLSQQKLICFIHGEKDTLIPSHHSHKLFQSFRGSKTILIFEGTHNSTRPVQLISKCFKFIEQALLRKQGKDMGEPQKLLESNHTILNSNQLISFTKKNKEELQEERVDNRERAKQNKLEIEEQFGEIGLKQSTIKEPLRSQAQGKGQQRVFNDRRIHSLDLQ